MRKKKKFKTATLILVLLIAALAVAFAVIVIGKSRMDMYRDNAAKLQLQISQNTRYGVYVAVEDILAGEELKEGTNIKTQTVISGLSDAYITSGEAASRALVNIPAGTPIQRNMVGEVGITGDMRDVEVNVLNLTTDQQENDIVDVRILFPDGTDYVVLSRKQLYDVSLTASQCHLHLTEDELLRLDSAIVDAYVYQTAASQNGMTGLGRLYTTRYIQPTIQEAAESFYPVRAETLDLINNDPNVVDEAISTLSSKAREDLERRLAAVSADALMKVEQGFSEQDDIRAAAAANAAQTVTDVQNPSNTSAETLEGGGN